ncbi:MAG: LysE family translocator [Halieaceae bacterium]|jgi:threonine/homoserine/homoserine lactone efflux protein|nr:LysE family translocator [Halieaceae bacterium]
MNFPDWMALAAVCLMGAMSPGPSLAVVLRHSLQGGRGAGLAAALSHGLAVALYAGLAVSGLLLVVSASSAIFNTLQFAGALFLVYLGVQSFRSQHGEGQADGETQASSLGLAARDGFVVAFLNPKLALFFLALFSQFLSADTAAGTRLLMVATMAGIDAGWYAAIALLLASSSRLAVLQERRRLISRGFGLLLLALGISMVYRTLAG